MFARISDIDRMFDAMGMLRGRLDSLYNELDRPAVWGGNWLTDGNFPRTNLYDRGDRFELIAEIPGLTNDDLEVKIQGNYLEISGNREVHEPEGYRVHRSERGSASFTRSLTLPADVDSSRADANLKDGILVLTLPKSEAAKPRQISIK
ncbi:MAG: Hsp20/alpha crystallin family protein [Desulfofustis sp.]|jgi:HSP20 family protein